MDISQLTAAPREVRYAGRVFRVAPLTLAQWGEVHAWIKVHAPSPVASLRSIDLAGLTPSHRREVMALALAESRAWPPAIASGPWFDLLSETAGGSAFFLHTVLRRLHPEITPEDAEILAGNEDRDESRELLNAAMGIDTPPKSSAPL